MQSLEQDPDSRTASERIVVAMFGGLVPLIGIAMHRALPIFPMEPFATPLETAVAVLAGALGLALPFTTGTSLGWLHARAAAIGVYFGAAMLYAVMFAPFVPLIVVGFAVVLGFFAAAPYWSLFVTSHLWGRLREDSAAGQVPALRRIVVACALLAPAISLAHDGPSLASYRAMAAAAHGDATDRQEGLRRLRGLPLRPQLEVCADGFSFYEQYYFPFIEQHPITRAWYLTLIWPLQRIDRGAAREAFYLAHGLPFSVFGEPETRPQWDDGRVPRFEDAFGDGAVRGRVPGLSIVRSDLEVDVDASAALAEIDWTIAVSNHTRFEQEARMGFALPPGAVASGLWLWIQGTERPAAFSCERQVAEAYTEIAQRQRLDPALLRETAPGRLRLLMSPVPPDGKPMQVRVRITAPLQVDDGGATLRLPTVFDRNVQFAYRAPHQVQLRDGGHRLSTFLTGSDLGRWTYRARHPHPTVAAQASESAVLQTMVRRAATPWGGPLVLVIDASNTVGSVVPELDHILSAWPDNTPCTVLIARHDYLTEHRGRCGSSGLRNALRHEEAHGGVYAGAALLRALAVARGAGAEHVIWLHGAQPHDPLAGDVVARAEATGIRIAAVPLTTLRNALRDRLARGGHVLDVRRHHGIVADLQHLVRVGLSENQEGDATASWLRSFTRVQELPDDTPVAGHALARLARARQAQTLYGAGQTVEASQLAATHRLVTAGAGAVVLETEEQYERFDLDPSAEDPDLTSGGGAPVPEPMTWLLMLTGGAVLWILRRRC